VGRWHPPMAAGGSQVGISFQSSLIQGDHRSRPCHHILPGSREAHCVAISKE
ncbi:hypothetical protein SK128_020110, partial [Halocaridina rubra]